MANFLNDDTCTMYLLKNKNETLSLHLEVKKSVPLKFTVWVSMGDAVWVDGWKHIQTEQLQYEDDMVYFL